MTTSPLATALHASVAAAPPAGGAPTKDLIYASLVAALLTAGLIAALEAYRRDRLPVLARVAAYSSRVSGMPPWASLPAAVAGGALLIAVTGFYWDVGTHIDRGRDAGPFGTAAHYPILIGLGGIAVAGLLAITLGWRQQRRPTWVRVQRGWWAPLGGILIAVCGCFALLGFPLDDVWHRLFGQDVTLWGPTHLLMIGGASLATLGVWALQIEGRRERQPDAQQHGATRSAFWRRQADTLSAGAFLMGMSTFQGEFDFGVPQFQLLYHPILIMLAAGLVLVPARVRIGRGGALRAVAFFLVLRGLLALLVGPALGHVTPHFPLYVGEALAVELAAWRMGVSRPIRLGVVSGALIGTIGLASEWGWSHVWMPIPWPASLLPLGALFGFLAALAGATLGGFIGRSLRRDPAAFEPAPRWLGPLAGAATVFCLAFPLPMNAGSPTSATVTLTPVGGGPLRTANATVRLTPASAADGADWFTVTAWQGHAKLVLERLRRVGPGVYATPKPIPLFGSWKAMLRLAKGRDVSAVPLYMPADAAIPAKGVAATPQFTRPFVRDKQILQREAHGGPPGLSLLAYAALLAIVVLWIGIIVWGLRRLDPAGPPTPRDGERRREPAFRRPATGTPTVTGGAT
jgi:hypothetical protein